MQDNLSIIVNNAKTIKEKFSDLITKELKYAIYDNQDLIIDDQPTELKIHNSPLIYVKSLELTKLFFKSLTEYDLTFLDNITKSKIQNLPKHIYNAKTNENYTIYSYGKFITFGVDYEHIFKDIDLLKNNPTLIERFVENIINETIIRKTNEIIKKFHKGLDVTQAEAIKSSLTEFYVAATEGDERGYNQAAIHLEKILLDTRQQKYKEKLTDKNFLQKALNSVNKINEPALTKTLNKKNIEDYVYHQLLDTTRALIAKQHHHDKDIKEITLEGNEILYRGIRLPNIDQIPEIIDFNGLTNQFTGIKYNVEIASDILVSYLPNGANQTVGYSTSANLATALQFADYRGQENHKYSLLLEIHPKPGEKAIAIEPYNYCNNFIAAEFEILFPLASAYQVYAAHILEVNNKDMNDDNQFIKGNFKVIKTFHNSQYFKHKNEAQSQIQENDNLNYYHPDLNLSVEVLRNNQIYNISLETNPAFKFFNKYKYLLTIEDFKIIKPLNLNFNSEENEFKESINNEPSLDSRPEIKNKLIEYFNIYEQYNQYKHTNKKAAIQITEELDILSFPSYYNEYEALLAQLEQEALYNSLDISKFCIYEYLT